MVCIGVFCFFKQKTAYELRISDWSSDVCSSDLPGTTAYPRVQFDAAAVQLDQALHQRQAQARAAVAHLQRAALELAEHAIAIGLGNADAGVRHLEQHLALGTASGERHHAALAGELQRVGQQVEQRLTPAAAVSHRSEESREGKECVRTGSTR